MLHGEFLYNYEKIRISTSIGTRIENRMWEIGDFYSLKYIRGSALSILLDGNQYYIPDKSVVLFEKFSSPQVSMIIPKAKINIINIDFKKSLYGNGEDGGDDIVGLLENIVGNIRKDNLSLPRVLVYHDSCQIVGDIFDDAMKEYKKREIKYLAVIKSYITAILIKMFRNVEDVNNATLEEDLIQRILDYAELYYTEKITLGELSKIFHYSESYIEKKFKKTMGMTFPEFFRQKKIYSSVGFVLNHYKNLDELAKSVGYSDAKAFSSSFKKYVGMTPLQYKKSTEGKKDWYLDMRDLKQQKNRPY